MKINELQRTVLRHYGEGAFAAFAEMDSIPDPRELSDPLLTYMLLELSDAKTEASAITPLDRLFQGRDELDIALGALTHLHTELAGRGGPAAPPITFKSVRPATLVLVDDATDAAYLSGYPVKLDGEGAGGIGSYAE